MIVFGRGRIRIPLGLYGASGVCDKDGQHTDWIVASVYGVFRLFWLFGLRGPARYGLVCGKCFTEHRANAELAAELRSRFGPPIAYLRDTLGLILLAVAWIPGAIIGSHPGKSGLGEAVFYIGFAVAAVAMILFGRITIPRPQWRTASGQRLTIPDTR